MPRLLDRPRTTGVPWLNQIWGIPGVPYRYRHHLSSCDPCQPIEREPPASLSLCACALSKTLDAGMT